MLKLKMMLCVMMLPLVVVGCTSKQSVSQCEVTVASGVDNAASPRLADTAERDYFNFRGEADHHAKQLEGTQKYINEIVEIELPISMGNSCNYCEQYTRASSGEQCLAIKPSNPFTNACWVSVLTTFSAPPQILAASTVFFLPNLRKRRNDG